QVERDPLVGGLFENLVVVEALKSRLNSGRMPNLHFFRDSNRREVDLLYPTDNGVIPVEIKSAMTYDREFLSGIHYFQKISTSGIPGWVIYAGELEFEGNDYRVMNYTNAFELS
ncbi:DUF4143 domain-containing protein, partial [Arthrospira platensis SPKY1]|nr:DUF4143 domain-containing protein [Arthrospira platensis SPKY1]